MLSIQHYGHYWSRAEVAWRGRAPEKGRLPGYRGERNPVVNDFSFEVAVYVLFADRREVVYIGQTGGGKRDRLFERLRGHTKDHLWNRWDHFSWFGFQTNASGTKKPKLQPSTAIGGTTAHQALDELEAVLIQLLEPRLNKQGPRWMGKSGVKTLQYYQYIPSEWADDDAEESPTTLDDLWEKFAELNKRLDRLSEKLE